MGLPDSTPRGPLFLGPKHPAQHPVGRGLGPRAQRWRGPALLPPAPPSLPRPGKVLPASRGVGERPGQAGGRGPPGIRSYIGDSFRRHFTPILALLPPQAHPALGGPPHFTPGNRHLTAHLSALRQHLLVVNKVSIYGGTGLPVALSQAGLPSAPMGEVC